MKKLLTILVVLGVVTCPVFAGAITDLGLFNTGNSSNWKVGGVTATTATTTPGGADPWVVNNGTSSWISTQANASTITDGASAAPVYNYTLQFTVPSTYALSSIIINGRWALDDFGTASIGSTVFSNMPDGGTHYNAGAFAGQTFSITSANGLALGANTLTFAVTNKFLGAGRINPTGVRVEFTSITGDLAAVPEPGTLVLLGGGLLALGFFRRRR
jgi:hypothetical protein